MAGISTNKKEKAAPSCRAAIQMPHGKRPITLVHISDLHAASTEKIPLQLLMNKRMLGWLRWKIKRSREYDLGILETVKRELQRIQADQIIITGDLTHLGLPAEFKEVSRWLKRLAPAEKITLVPGNHDTYAPSAWKDSFSHLENYILPASCYKGTMPPPSLEALFPTVRLLDNIALIGLSTARPCALHLATGTVGKSQLQRLKAILHKTAGGGFFRVLALHHPPAPGVVKPRKELTDAGPLLEIIKKYGCELILHGHSHRTNIYSVDGPHEPIPVVEAPSVLSISHDNRRRARYFIYQITGSQKQGWNLTLTQKILASLQEGFRQEDRRQFYCRAV